LDDALEVHFGERLVCRSGYLPLEQSQPGVALFEGSQLPGDMLQLHFHLLQACPRLFKAFCQAGRREEFAMVDPTCQRHENYKGEYLEDPRQ